jgi:hypothetical protein
MDIISDEESELIVGVDVRAGNAADGEGAAPLLDERRRLGSNQSHEQPGGRWVGGAGAPAGGVASGRGEFPGHVVFALGEEASGFGTGETETGWGHGPAIGGGSTTS